MRAALRGQPCARVAVAQPTHLRWPRAGLCGLGHGPWACPGLRLSRGRRACRGGPCWPGVRQRVRPRHAIRRHAGSHHGADVLVQALGAVLGHVRACREPCGAAQACELGTRSRNAGCREGPASERPAADSHGGSKWCAAHLRVHRTRRRSAPTAAPCRAAAPFEEGPLGSCCCASSHRRKPRWVWTASLARSWPAQQCWAVQLQCFRSGPWAPPADDLAHCRSTTWE
jgi:hypothetical protein